MGYFSYDYGRKLQGVPSGEKDLVKIPDAVLTFYDVYIIEDCHKKRNLSGCKRNHRGCFLQNPGIEQKLGRSQRRRQNRKLPYDILVLRISKEEYKKR